MECGYVFENKKRKNTGVAQQLWEQYVRAKQTYLQLAAQYGISERTVQRKLESIRVQEKVIQSKDAVVVMDTSYFGRTFGVMVFRDVERKKNIHWRMVSHETIKD